MRSRKNTLWKNKVHNAQRCQQELGLKTKLTTTSSSTGMTFIWVYGELEIGKMTNVLEPSDGERAWSYPRSTVNKCCKWPRRGIIRLELGGYISGAGLRFRVYQAQGLGISCSPIRVSRDLRCCSLHLMDPRCSTYYPTQQKQNIPINVLKRLLIINFENAVYCTTVRIIGRWNNIEHE